MNVQLKDITVTARDGRVSHLDQVYIRGSHVRFFIVPDMLRYISPPHYPDCVAQDSTFPSLLFFPSLVYRLQNSNSNKKSNRNAPMFRSRGQRGRGVGLARGKATVQRARGQRRG